MSTIGWNDDTQDWKQIPPDLIETKVFDQIKPGAIIIMHSGSPDYGANLSGTVEALPRIIKRLREEGYEPVTLSQLLGISAYQDGDNADSKASQMMTSTPVKYFISPKASNNVSTKKEIYKSDLRLDSEEYSLVTGERLDTQVTCLEDGHKRDVTMHSNFSISDPTIASVDSMGNITGLKRGATMLTVTYYNLKVTAKVYVYGLRQQRK
ncbi:hypothetical protein PP175_18250 [Aneurinibacillus sp. Ricciae_BoGa-3]|uniref:hypothetical protein n=1 Tax=Aneurinibacillus sp. Ricciae_BoGa-3 TaxID=3022697 RepID=UPI00233FC7CB|nr:hypothetical protein [Aneurinibacillus sp. Ricciae_BoGa-3]WCK53308.1 hypothetical protein PP175_18250 [Aneurinibacillus sp. Ricciae_BoGa-3]